MHLCNGLARRTASFSPFLRFQQEIIRESGNALQLCLRFIESEIERLSQPEENGKDEAPLPTHKWGAMPWDQERDETGVYAELVQDETTPEGKTKSAVRPLSYHDVISSSQAHSAAASEHT
jgi:hypothetical protein